MTNDSRKGCGYEKVKRNVLGNLEQGDEERRTQGGCIELPGRDNEAETPLLEIIFDITGSAQKLEPAVSAVDIFDEEYRDETYHISNSSYER